MEVGLLYGKGIKKVTLPPGMECVILRKKEMPISSNPTEELIEALNSPIGSPPLAEMLSPGMRVAVAISDITRPVPNQVLLPPLLHLLEKKGIKRDEITIITASGTHRKMSEEELLELAGKEIVEKYRIVQHDARDEEGLSFLGKTKRGTPILINREFLSADLKIAVGLIEPHFMFGYSGGVKSIAPGLSGMETVKFLHGIDILADERSATGVIEGNPCREEAKEIAERVGLSFIVNVVITERRDISGIFAGDPISAFEEGARFLDRYAKVKVKEPVPLVLTSSAGYPLDTTFYQAVKGMVVPLPITEDGGIIILAAECSQGIGGPEFIRLLQGLTDFDHFLAHHRKMENFVPDQWEVQELIKALKKVEVFLYSEGLKGARLDHIPRLRLISSIEEGIDMAAERLGRNIKTAIIPEGPYIIPTL